MDRNTKIILVLIVVIIIIYLLREENEYIIECVKPGERCIRGRDECCEEDDEKYVCYQSRCVKENVVPRRRATNDLTPDFISLLESRKPLPVETRVIDQQNARPDGSSCNFEWECDSKICHNFICRSDLSVDRTGSPIISSEPIETVQQIIQVPTLTPTPTPEQTQITKPEVVVIDKKTDEGICTIL